MQRMLLDLTDADLATAIWNARFGEGSSATWMSGFGR
jgi:hypothetical protein